MKTKIGKFQRNNFWTIYLGRVVYTDPFISQLKYILYFVLNIINDEQRKVKKINCNDEDYEWKKA